MDFDYRGYHVEYNRDTNLWRVSKIGNWRDAVAYYDGSTFEEEIKTDIDFQWEIRKYE